MLIKPDALDPTWPDYGYLLQWHQYMDWKLISAFSMNLSIFVSDLIGESRSPFLQLD